MGISKRKKKFYEQDIDCARREFSEETGISGKYYELIDCNRIYETFKGGSNVLGTDIFIMWQN